MSTQRAFFPLIVVLFGLAFLANVSAQTLRWTKELGTPVDDACYGVVVSPDGSAVYATGSTSGALDGQTSAGASDVFLIKWNAQGTKLWTKQFGTAGDEYGGSIAITADGSFIYVSGDTSGNLGGQTNAGGTDAFVTKWNSDGTLIWTRLLGTSVDESGGGVAVSADGSIVYLAGTTRGNLSGQTNSGDADAFLSKWNADGERSWTRLVGSPQEDSGFALTATRDGSSAVLTGRSLGNMSGQTNAGQYDIFLTKWNADGSTAWTRMQGTPANDEGSGITSTADGTSIYVTGYVVGNLDGQTGFGDADIILTRWNPDGTKAWTRLLGNTTNEFGFGVAVSGNGQRIYVTGYTDESLDGQPFKGVADVFLASWFSNGTKIPTTKLFGTNDTDYGNAVSTNIDGSVVVVAGSVTGSLDGQTFVGGADLFVSQWAVEIPADGGNSSPASRNYGVSSLVAMLCVVMAFVMRLD